MNENGTIQRCHFEEAIMELIAHFGSIWSCKSDGVNRYASMRHTTSCSKTECEEDAIDEAKAFLLSVP